jgi:hypothetical protein
MWALLDHMVNDKEIVKRYFTYPWDWDAFSCMLHRVCCITDERMMVVWRVSIICIVHTCVECDTCIYKFRFSSWFCRHVCCIVAVFSIYL